MVDGTIDKEINLKDFFPGEKVHLAFSFHRLFIMAGAPDANMREDP